MGQLDGKVAIVTGAGRGIGRAVARLFAAEGAKVGIISRTQESVDRVVGEIEQAGGAAIGIAADVGVRPAAFAAVQAVADRFGPIDVLVNNARGAENIRTLFIDTTEELLLAHFTGAVMGAVNFMQACYPHLKARRGKVINFGSASGFNGAMQQSAYAAGKEAVRAISRVAAREWGPDGINVNVVCPLAFTDGLAKAMQDPTVAATFAAMPLGRPGSPEDDIAPVVLFLATEAARYLTGHTFMVDGGNLIDAGR
jgi:3-oxoacyl-[acyl-carrier protein] reductase